MKALSKLLLKNHQNSPQIFKGSFAFSSSVVPGHKQQPVIIDLNDLKRQDTNIFEQIEEAYSDKGLGVLLVRNSGESKQRYMQNYLNLAKQMRQISEYKGDLSYLEQPHLEYGHGLNLGKDGYLEGGDTLQISFYANIIQESYTDHKGLIWKNVWPKDKEIAPEFEKYYMSTGRQFIDTAIMLGKKLDDYLKYNVKNYKMQIEQGIAKSPRISARSIYYAAPKNKHNSDLPKNWCSWHKDYSYITGLAPGVYVDSQDNVKHSNGDPEAGLYIQKRDYEILKLNIPEDCMCFQLGELSQIVSGGLLQALPHAVKMPVQNFDMPRISLAVFMEPEYNEPLSVPVGTNMDRVLTKQDKEHKLSPLEERWKDGMSFGDYYENCRISFSYAPDVNKKQ
ncbi:UNKNOWN [Stylonychia lemnae]|uniref:Uncharacterized protein n=1 Tax=Stylonychia lemnae TaxID=5949 RepID=A0A078A587_STYLE|nr:UNKNOWN [Stylonychia lemnae]|eukprot:CDW77364.1 UNKNOWN [Stylonychia lemnae]